MFGQAKQHAPHLKDLVGNAEVFLEPDKKPAVVAIVGPTCSGKTALSLELAGELNAEIIACDSRTIYRHMDIGTAKPSIKERADIAHHMLDIIDPSEMYSVAQYQQQANKCLEQISEQGKLPMVVGGTGFYARALLEGLEIPKVEPQPQLRLSLKHLAEVEGNEALHQKLQQLDEVSAARINVNDVFRIVRALEVSLVCGKPFSQLVKHTDSPYRTIWIGLTVSNRSLIHEAISHRFGCQMKAGLLDEVKELLDQYGPCQSLMNTVNYRELVLYMQGQLDLTCAEEKCIQHNCQLARRQLIWFRANPSITWFTIDTLTARQLKEQILAFIASSL